MSPRSTTRAQRRFRQLLVRGAVWAFILLFVISAVGAIFVVYH